MHKTIEFIMKNLFVATAIVFLNSEVFAIERCPEGVRLADLKKIADVKEGDSFQWKGETWTLTHSNGAWQQYLEIDTPIGNSFLDSRIIIKKDKEILHCEYQVFEVREDKHHSIKTKRGQFFVETIIND